MKNLTGILKFSIPLIAASFATGCGGDSHYPIFPFPPTHHGDTKVFTVDFNDSAKNGGSGGWIAGFADYPAGSETFYELSSGYSTLPASLGEKRKGFKLSGNNHSDDLFMFIAKKFTGLSPNTRYDVQFDVTFGTDAKSNCFGVGGAPGESVTVKAGATKVKPEAVNNGAETYLMNIDKGNQTVGGSDAIAIGNVANGRDCESPDNSYLKKHVKSEKGSFSTFTSPDGSLWVLFSTDSGYEATTTIYFMNAKIIARKK